MVAHSAGRLRGGRARRRRPTPRRRSPPATRRRRRRTSSRARAEPSAGSTRVRRGPRDEVDRHARSSRAAGACASHAAPRALAAAAARARAGRRAARAPRAARRRSRRELARSRHDVELHTAAPDGRGKFENLNPLLAAHPADGQRLAARGRRRRRAAARLPRPLPVPVRALLAELAQPAHRLHSHAAWPVTRRRAAQRRARDELRRDRPGDGVRARHLPRRCCRSRSCGWAGGSTCTGRRSRASTAGAAASSTPCAIGHRAAPAAAAYAREAAVAEARAFLAGRPYLSAARPSARSRPTAAGEALAGSSPRVAVVAEFYPSRRDPVLGIWAHRQALAARDAGAEVRVLVLHRLVPPRAVAARRRRRALRARCGARCASRDTQMRDGLAVAYVPYVSPPRERSYPRWGAWAAPPLALALRRLRALLPVRARSTPTTPCPPPTPCAARRIARARWSSPCTAATCSTRRAAARAGATAVARGLGAARLVLANSQGIAELARAHGAGETRVRAPRRRAAADRRHSRAAAARRASRRRSSPSPTSSRASATPTCCARWPCSPAPPDAALRDRRRRPRADTRSKGSPPGSGWPSGSTSTASWRPTQALERRARCTLFVMPSTEEAFGVAYVEAMAARRARDRLPRRARAPRRSRRRATASCSCRRATSSGSPSASTSCCPTPTGCARPGSARARPWRRTSPGSAAASRRWRPTSDVLAVKPVLFVTGHAPAYRVGALAAPARARGHRAGAVRRPLHARRRRRREGEPARSRTAACARASSAGWRRAGATARWCARPAGAWRRWRRGRRARRARRAADPVGVAVGAPAQRRRTRSATCRCGACTARPTRS